MEQASVFPPPLGAAVSYLRSQVTAVAATAVDFAVLIGLVEWFGVYYVAATCIGAVCGGVVSFVLNRNWSFAAESGRMDVQAFRYAMVWVGSIGMNAGLVYALTEHGSLNYQISKIVTAIAVGTLFNFPLHRYFCFSQR